MPETRFTSVKKLVGTDHFQHREGYDGCQQQQCDQVDHIEPEKYPPVKTAVNISGYDECEEKVEQGKVAQDSRHTEHYGINPGSETATLRPRDHPIHPGQQKKQRQAVAAGQSKKIEQIGVGNQHGKNRKLQYRR